MDYGAADENCDWQFDKAVRTIFGKGRGVGEGVNEKNIVRGMR